jgi:hypothetical protein
MRLFQNFGFGTAAYKTARTGYKTTDLAHIPPAHYANYAGCRTAGEIEGGFIFFYAFTVR